MLKIIYGRARTGKTARIVAEISARVQAKLGFAYYIIPEQYSHEAERELCRRAGDSLALFAETTSFTRLFYSLTAQLGGGAVRFLDNGGKILALARAYEAVLPNLRILGRSELRAKVLPALTYTMNEFAAAKITPEETVDASLRLEGALRDKLCDLAEIYEAYRAICAQGEADPGSILDRVAQMTAKSARMRGAAVYIDGFVDFTEQEYAIIEAMLLTCGDITICLTCDDLRGGSEVHEMSRIAARRITEIAKSRGIPTEMEQSVLPESVTPLDFLRERLFSYSREETDCGDSVRLFRAPSLGIECEIAAAEALRLVRETGCRFRDITIVVRGFEHYRAALSAVFGYYGVPLYMSRKSGVGEKPLPLLIKYAYAIISSGWDGGDVCDYARTGLSGISAQDCDILENYIYMWNIKGSGFLSDRPWTMHPRGFGMEFVERDSHLLEKINEIRERIMSPLLRLSLQIRGTETAREQAAALSQFLVDAKLPETLASLTDRLTAGGDEVAAAEYGQIWEITVRALEQTALMLGDSPLESGEFSKLFLLVLDQYSVGTIPQTLDAVTAGDMDRMRRRSIRHLIVLGASEDRLPSERSYRGILTEMERTSLAERGLLLSPSIDDGLFRELNLIYNCLAMPVDSITMCYSENSGEEGRAAPSYIFERVARLFSLEPATADPAYLRTFALRPAFELASGAENGNSSLTARAARKYFARTPQDGLLTSIAKAANGGRGQLSRRAVELLYGKSPRLSSTRIEEFAGCRFKYFMNYGLRLIPKERAEFSAPEAGSFIHYLLEKTTHEIMNGVGFENADEALVNALSDKYSGLYAQEKLGGLQNSDSRFKYLFSRLALSGRRIVQDTVNDLAHSKFRPLDFELAFTDLSGALTSDGIRLSGKVDRVDGYMQDGRLYIRVVDYKSGKKDFALRDILGGLNMQMLLYLFALEKSGREIFGEPCFPAGVLYVPSRDEFIVTAARGESDTALEKKRRAARRRRGLLLNDPAILSAMDSSDETTYLPYDGRSKKIDLASLADEAQLQSLRGFIRERVLELGDGIRGGHIESNPVEPDERCSYCEFSDACRFDPDRDEPRFPPKISIDEIWDTIRGCGK